MVHIEYKLYSFLQDENTISIYKVRLKTEKDETVFSRVIDSFGIVLLNNKQANIFKGVNTININEIGRINSGAYSVQIRVNNQMFAEKLIVTKK